MTRWQLLSYRGRLATTTGLVVLGLIAAAIAGASTAGAWYNDPHVHMSGHIDCGGIDEAWNMTWSTSNGERGSANLSTWTGVSRWVWFVRATRLIKVQTYNLDLWNVPKSGTTLSYTITCGNQWLGWTGQFSQSYGVNRPTFGSSGTRHICRNAALGCWV